jgi:hypothetical protein
MGNGDDRKEKRKKIIDFSVFNNFKISLPFDFPGSGAHRHGSAFRGGPAVPLSRKKATRTRWKLPILPLRELFGVPLHVQIKPRNNQLESAGFWYR